MNAQDLSEKFEEQNSTHNVNMSLIRDQYNKVSALHDKKVGKLRVRNEELNKKLAQTKEKR